MRFLLWVVVIYVIWKIARSVASHSRSGYPRSGQSNPSQKKEPSFNNVEDADFEDITTKPDPKS